MKYNNGQKCNNCRSYGYQCTHMPNKPEKEGPLSNSFVFKISDLVPTSGVIAATQNRNGQYSSTTVQARPQTRPDGGVLAHKLPTFGGKVALFAYLLGTHLGPEGGVATPKPPPWSRA